MTPHEAIKRLAQGVDDWSESDWAMRELPPERTMLALISAYLLRVEGELAQISEELQTIRNKLP